MVNRRPETLLHCGIPVLPLLPGPTTFANQLPNQIQMKTNSGAPSQKGGLVRSPRHLLAGFKALSSSQCGQNGLVLQQRCVAM